LAQTLALDLVEQVLLVLVLQLHPQVHVVRHVHLHLFLQDMRLFLRGLDFLTLTTPDEKHELPGVVGEVHVRVHVKGHSLVCGYVFETKKVLRNVDCEFQFFIRFPRESTVPGAHAEG